MRDIFKRKELPLLCFQQIQELCDLQYLFYYHLKHFTGTEIITLLCVAKYYSFLYVK